MICIAVYPVYSVSYPPWLCQCSLLRWGVVDVILSQLDIQIKSKSSLSYNCHCGSDSSFPLTIKKREPA